MPERIQRKRSKGWRMPEGAIYVGRPSRWGNPWRVRHGDDEWQITEHVPDLGETAIEYYGGPAEARAAAVAIFRAVLFDGVGDERPEYPTIAEIRVELDGHDLACWCPLDQPCHADVLLELANAERGQA